MTKISDTIDRINELIDKKRAGTISEEEIREMQMLEEMLPTPEKEEVRKKSTKKIMAKKGGLIDKPLGPGGKKKKKKGKK